MDVAELLERLDEYLAQKTLLEIDKKRAIEATIPQDVRDAVADIEAEFDDKLSAADENIAAIEKTIKDEVLRGGQTVKGKTMQAVYAKGRVTYSAKALDGLLVAIPQLNDFRKVGKPSVSIRKVG